MPLPYQNNEGVAYAFLDKVLNKFDILVEVFTNQGMAHGVPKVMCENIDQSSYNFTTPS
jgi:hypothetical protein